MEIDASLSRSGHGCLPLLRGSARRLEPEACRSCAGIGAQGLVLEEEGGRGLVPWSFVSCVRDRECEECVRLSGDLF